MTSTRHIARAFIMASLISTAACGAAATRTGARPRPQPGAVELPTGVSIRDRISAAELKSVGGTTADAVRVLRPEFLRARDPHSGAGESETTPSIYVNGRYAGEAHVLALIPLDVVVEVYYVGAIAAKGMFGSHCPCDRGVIFVVTAR